MEQGEDRQFLKQVISDVRYHNDILDCEINLMDEYLDSKKSGRPFVLTSSSLKNVEETVEAHEASNHQKEK